MRVFPLILVVFTILSLGLTPLQADIVVDGSWSDWGINPTTNDWDASVGSRIFYEDYAGTDGNGFIGPGWGGQFFDVTAMYARHNGSSLDYAIVTGFDLDGVNYKGKLYTAGDVFFDIGTGWDVAQELTSGNVYDNVTGTVPSFATSAPFKIDSGNLVGPGSLDYTSDGAITTYSDGDQSTTHYMIEGSIDLNAINAANLDIGVHWTMSCGNDVGEGYISAPVPEPATMLLFGIGSGLAALGYRRKRKHN